MMKSRKFWLSIINVYPGEWWVVKRLYLLQFFQGAGIAFFFTSAFAQFLEKYPITELPWVMVCSAILLWATGFIYTRLEHRLQFGKFNIRVILFMGISMLTLWAAGFMIESEWFLYLMLAWFNVLYLLNNMEFWGIAALLFDLRQSKRLFAVISSGDIPAKFIGYTLALIVVPYTGTQNLLLAGAVCMFASIPFFTQILTSGKLEVHHGPSHHKHRKEPKKEVGKIVSNILTNHYIRRIAFISVLASACVIMLNYGFYGEIKKAYSDDVQLAKFIAFFYAAIRVVAFVTKVVFTSRLTASLGIRPALFITPVGMMIMAVGIAVAEGLSDSQKLIFYLFGLGSMIIDVLRTSFNSPVLLTLMQPLPTHERLRAHNIVKGIMDPFASLLSGIFLLSIFHIHGRVDLMFLCYVLFILGVMWTIGVVLVNKQYLAILMKTIGSRYFSRDEFNLNDQLVTRHLKQKMMNGSEIEVIGILSMLNSKRIDSVAGELITQLLKHPSDKVRIEAIRLINSNKFSAARIILDTLVNDNSRPEVKQEAVKSLCAIADSDESITVYLNHWIPGVRLAAIQGMLNNAKGIIRERARELITTMLKSGQRTEQLQAVTILTNVQNQYSHPEHATLFDSRDPEIVMMAINAVGESAHPDTLSALLALAPIHEKQVLSAFQRAGQRSVTIIRDYLYRPDSVFHLREKFITVLGKIGDQTSKDTLVTLLTDHPGHLSTIIRALQRCRYMTDFKTLKQFEQIARTYLIYGIELLHMQKNLSGNDKQQQLLNSSLQYEIHNIRDILLSLFACMYDRDKISQVKHGLLAKQKESIANAMEIIDLTVRKDIGRQFNIMFEITSVEHRCNMLKSLFAPNQYEKVELIIGRILSEQPILYYNWTKACSMYISKTYIHRVNEGYYKKYLLSDSRLLKETAIFATTPT
jgi:ATP/ADP translocase